MFKNWLIKKLGGKLQSEFDAIKNDLENALENANHEIEELKNNQQVIRPIIEQIPSDIQKYQGRIPVQKDIMHEYYNEEELVSKIIYDTVRGEVNDAIITALHRDRLISYKVVENPYTGLFDVMFTLYVVRPRDGITHVDNACAAVLEKLSERFGTNNGTQ